MLYVKNMRVFIDTNVIIDFYDKRIDFYLPASQIFELAKKDAFEMAVSSISFVNAFYLLRKSYSKEELYNLLNGLSKLCKIAPVGEKEIKEGLALFGKDFEDSVQYKSAISTNADVIVTRNKKDFDSFNLKVMTPIEFLDDFFAKKQTQQK